MPFYALAPALAFVFAIRSPWQKRGLLAGLALAFAAWNQVSLFEFRSLLNYAHFFLAGWLLADLHVSRMTTRPKKPRSANLDLVFGIFCWLSLPLFTGIGGMCYSIYLLHYPLISLFGNALVKLSFSSLGWVQIWVIAALLVLIVLSISSAFFLLIERPCMDRNWMRNLALRFADKRRIF